MNLALLKNGDSFELSSAEGNLIEASIEWNEDGAPLSELSFFSPDCEIKITREKGNPHLCQSLCTDGHCLYFSGPADADAPADLVASQLSTTSIGRQHFSWLSPGGCSL